MKLAKEAEGDGQRAIDAAKTLLNIETADLKLQQAAMGTQAQALTAMANWAKANNIKTSPKTLNAAVQFIDKRSGISIGKFDPKKQARWDIIAAHVMANLNNPSIWGDFPQSGEGFSDRAFSGKPNISATDAINQVKKGLAVGKTNLKG